MEDLEYITQNALMMCDQGAAPDFFKPTSNNKVKIHGCLVATKVDFVPLTNIPSFKICKLTQKPCMPATAAPWLNPWQVKVNGQETLIGRCKCKCTLGGTIEFLTSGQIPLPDEAQEEVEALQKQAQKELDDSGNGDSVGEAGFVEGMIPVWGSGRDMVNAIQTGDTFGAVLNAGFLIWDVASIAVGVVSFGAGTVAMQGGKAALKGGIKAGAKKIGKKALQGLGKSSFKKLSKDALKKSIDDVAKKLCKTCVFACFPAGTPIHTEFGIQNIEDIREGDRVWAYNEETGDISLKEVLQMMESETDHTIKIYTEHETIETTALHPFYVDGEWVDASELKAGDKLITKEKEEVEIKDTEFHYESKKVFNFEVEGWHTYFVGLLMLLVHNAGRCLSKMILEAQGWFKNVRHGYFFNLLWNSELRKQALEKGFKYSQEVKVLLKNGKDGFIDGLVKLKDKVYIIERKATDLSKVTEKTAKSYIDDAAKYGESVVKETGQKVDADKIILHVEKIGDDVSEEVFKHAEKRKVEIVEDIFTVLN